MQILLRLLLGLLLLLCFAPARCQLQSISGKITSVSDSLPIGYAHVYLKNAHIGTYSNAEGDFELHFSDTLVVDTLIVSRVGFDIFSSPIRDLSDISELNLQMKESANYLDAVIIYSDPDTAAVIVKKAFKRLRKNFPTRSHHLEGFFRELSLKGDSYTRLIEAAVNISESSYRRDYTSSQVEIHQLRKSEDYRSYDLKFKAAEEVFKRSAKLMYGKTYAHYNTLYRLLNNNVARSNKIVGTGKKKKVNVILEKYEYRITKVTWENADKIYHIEFQQPLEEASPGSFVSGKIVINMSDYGILEHLWTTSRHPQEPFAKQNLFYKDEILMESRSLFTKIDGKYYPTLLELFEPAPLSTGLYEDDKGIKRRQFTRSTLMINHVYTRRGQFKRIKSRDALDDELDLYEVDFPYDPDFWSNYNMLLLDPLLRPALDDLSREESLEAQFKRNGE